jgi:ArsR family transcriptional regulator, lead/cadmium/zinc/bismuth-responsive transcriptional repressor
VSVLEGPVRRRSCARALRRALTLQGLGFIFIIEQLFIYASVMKTQGLAPTVAVDGEVCDVLHSDEDRVAQIRSTLIPGRDLAALAETFKILGDQTRVRLLDALSKVELCVCDLASLLGLTESAVSHQLRLLRGTRVVRARREGRMVFYSLDDQHILSLFQQGLRHVEEASAMPGRARPASRAFEPAPAAGTPLGSTEDAGESDLPRRGVWE